MAAQRVDRYLTNSETTRSRIASYFGRDASVVYPPVRVERFSPAEPGDHYLVLSELVSHKQIDVAVKAFAELDAPLVVVGDGPALRDLRRLASPRVRFAGRVSDAEAAELMATCRAFVVTATEEFGIAAVEAQAAGRPVIARRGGGVLETVIENVTGCYWEGGPASSRRPSAGSTRWPWTRRRAWTTPVASPATCSARGSWRRSPTPSDRRAGRGPRSARRSCRPGCGPPAGALAFRARARAGQHGRRAEELPSRDVDESALTERLITYDTSALEGMQAAAAFVYGWLEARDVEVKGETHNGRPVLAATVGAAQGPTVVLHGHLDVVPGNQDQFTPRVEGDRLIGRGAYDMKGGLAAMMCAVRELADQDAVKVHFVCVSDEESDEQKHRASDFVVEKGYVGDFAITGEPTDLRIGIQAKGVLGLRLEVRGRSAHGSTPWLGDNAVLKAVDTFRAIESMPFTRASSELFDRPSISLGRIIGGDAVEPRARPVRDRPGHPLPAGPEPR